MKKLFKWLAIGTACLLVLVVLAGLILPSIIDPNEHKPRIEAELTKAMGRSVRLAGPLSWSVFPWVAIEAADVSVANAAGFAAENLLSVDLASARVKLLPLLSGQVQVGKVVLKEPRVNLEIDAGGASNWASLLSGAPAAEEPQTPADSTELDLNVAGVQIVDAAVSYTDRGQDLAASITGFNLTTGTISKKAPLDIDLSMNLMVDKLLDAAVSVRVEGRNLLGGGAPVIAVSELTVDGKYLADASAQLPFSLSLSEPLTLDQGKDQLSASGLVFASGDMRVEIDVQGQTEGTLTGSLRIARFDLRQWLAQSLGTSLDFADAEALTAFSLDSAFSMTGNRASLSELSIGLDDTTIKGTADLSDISGPNGKFSVSIDAIDVDRYLPASSAEEAPAASESSLTLEDLAIGNLQGDLTIGELRVAGLTASDVSLTMQTSPDGVTLEPMQARLYDGALKTTVRLGPGAGSGRLALTQSLTAVQAGPLLTDLLGQQYMTGTGNLETRLNIDDALGANPLANANGQISFGFADGAIFGMDVVGALQKAAALLGGGGNEQKADEEEQPATRFSRIEMVANITDGVLTTETLALESPLLAMGGQVTINLADMSLSGVLEPTIVDPAGLGALERFAGVAIPVRLSGSLNSPGVSIDPAKLALASQQQKIDKKKDELLGRLMGGDEKDEESDPDAEADDSGDKKKKLLKSLFGKDDDDDGN